MLPPHKPPPPTQGNGHLQGGGVPNQRNPNMQNRVPPAGKEVRPPGAALPMNAGGLAGQAPSTNGGAPPQPGMVRHAPPHASAGNIGGGAARSTFGGASMGPHAAAGPTKPAPPSYPQASFPRGPPQGRGLPTHQARPQTAAGPPQGYPMRHSPPVPRPSPPPDASMGPRLQQHEEMRMGPQMAAAQAAAAQAVNRPAQQPQQQPHQQAQQAPQQHHPVQHQQPHQQPRQQQPVQHQQQQPIHHQPPQQQQQRPPAAPHQAEGPEQFMPAPGGGGGGMRELRVEDALIYLDDVKREFGDRPRIYNEFLEIMKNFKSQEVDTPGVIDRVSRLFRGYNKLILGFNKFLPEGYKISLEDLQRRERERQAEEAAAAGSEGNAYYGHVRPQGHMQSGPGMPPQQVQSSQLQGKEGGQAHLQGHGMAGAKTNSPTPAGGVQAQAYQHQRPQEGGGGQLARPAQAQPAPSPGAMQQHGNGGATPQQHQHAQAMGHPQQQAAPGGQMGPRGPQPVQQQHQAVEFDHAISYVTNIKKRFANDPGTYHAFLEILHTYQKEQRGIKEVLEQVAALFADHPDLLKEFTFFLPDAVQEQAKERLHRAAADSEARQAAAAQRGTMESVYGEAGARQMMSHSFRGMRVESGRLALQQAQAAGGQKFIDMTGQEGRDARAQSSRKRPFVPGSPEGARLVAVQPTQPESFVYNAAVERQFFDAAKEALTAYTRDGGQAWAEFLKCLDMYAQEILSRNEMLNFVEPLLGKRNSELFEEFKRILAAAGSLTGPAAPANEDSWHSVPLAEIDFSRCRRCSPSYRALPRDYPAPPCSDRSDEEAKILNDIWVSLPVGSEESYTFRHMRRNQYEEVLFRCEDERFEIDMVIDSNAATLRRLEPIAEEIMQLSQEELVTPDLPSAAGSSAKSSPDGEGGMGGMRFQFTFDRKILGVIHRNSIARIYGDAGQEMLDLLVKNPTVAVPVVVQRLRQKDREWRAVRDRLNRHWKELAEMNFYKSLDNRSLTWRTIDKRATSTRTLVSEIKDRAANGGNESEAAIAIRRDKAKEEHGAFYEVTMKERLTTKLDLTNLPKPCKSLFTPHLSIMYDNNSWAQRDAYRILSFALERGGNSPTDKERGNRIWREFLGPFFGISLSWMQRPALSFEPSAADAPVTVSNGEDSGHDDDDESQSADENDLGNNVVTEEMRAVSTKSGENGLSGLMGHHPIPAGAFVSTVYGEGRILEFRQEDKVYVISLPLGKAYLQPSAVLCTVLTVEKSSYTNQLREKDTSKLERVDDMMVVGTQSLYLFFRLHQILVRRLGIAKDLAYKVPTDKTLSTLVEQMSDDGGQKRYESFLSLVYALIDGDLNHMGPGSGAVEGGKYEDRVRCLLGHGAYELATMDKLISHLLRNLQNLGSDETMQNLVQLFRRHLDAGSFKPDAFRQEAAYLSDGENMFCFQLCKVPDTDKRVLYTEFLGVISESESEEAMEVEPEVAATAEPAPKRQRRNKDSA